MLLTSLSMVVRLRVTPQAVLRATKGALQKRNLSILKRYSIGTVRCWTWPEVARATNSPFQAPLQEPFQKGIRQKCAKQHLMDGHTTFGTRDLMCASIESGFCKAVHALIAVPTMSTWETNLLPGPFLLRTNGANLRSSRVICAACFSW